MQLSSSWGWAQAVRIALEVSSPGALAGALYAKVDMTHFAAGFNLGFPI